MGDVIKQALAASISVANERVSRKLLVLSKKTKKDTLVRCFVFWN